MSEVTHFEFSPSLNSSSFSNTPSAFSLKIKSALSKSFVAVSDFFKSAFSRRPSAADFVRSTASLAAAAGLFGGVLFAQDASADEAHICARHTINNTLDSYGVKRFGQEAEINGNHIAFCQPKKGHDHLLFGALYEPTPEQVNFQKTRVYQEIKKGHLHLNLKGQVPLVEWQTHKVVAYVDAKGFHEYLAQAAAERAQQHRRKFAAFHFKKQHLAAGHSYNSKGHSVAAKRGNAPLATAAVKKAPAAHATTHPVANLAMWPFAVDAAYPSFAPKNLANDTGYAPVDQIPYLPVNVPANKVSSRQQFDAMYAIFPIGSAAQAVSAATMIDLSFTPSPLFAAANLSFVQGKPPNMSVLRKFDVLQFVVPKKVEGAASVPIPAPPPKWVSPAPPIATPSSNHLARLALLGDKDARNNLQLSRLVAFDQRFLGENHITSRLPKGFAPSLERVMFSPNPISYGNGKLFQETAKPHHQDAHKVRGKKPAPPKPNKPLQNAASSAAAPVGSAPTVNEAAPAGTFVGMLNKFTAFLRIGRSDVVVDPHVKIIRQAIQSRESSGGKNIDGVLCRNGDRAHGPDQIMGDNIGPWSEQILGRRLETEEFMRDPDAQTRIALAKMNEYYQDAKKVCGDNMRCRVADVASMWFTGLPAKLSKHRKDPLGTTAPRYINQVINQVIAYAASDMPELRNAPAATAIARYTNHDKKHHHLYAHTKTAKRIVAGFHPRQQYITDRGRGTGAQGRRASLEGNAILTPSSDGLSGFLGSGAFTKQIAGLTEQVRRERESLAAQREPKPAERHFANLSNAARFPALRVA
jgi:hypothetical protein